LTGKKKEVDLTRLF